MKVIDHPAKAIRDELEMLKRRMDALEDLNQGMAQLLYAREKRSSKIAALFEKVVSLLRSNVDDE